MKQMKNIIDTWDMIEKYDLQGCTEKNSRVIEIPEVEYNRLMDSVINKQYIKNITYQGGLL